MGKVNHLSSRDLCILLDTETTGLSPKKDRIVQIGAHCLRTKDQTGSSFYFKEYVNPHHPVSPGSLKVHRISQSTLERADTFAKVYERFIRWIASFGTNKNIILLAHNGHKFDFPLLETELVRHGVDPGLLRTAVLCDSVFVFKKWFPGQDSYSLGKLHMKIAGREIPNAHDALADVLAIRTLVKCAIKKLQMSSQMSSQTNSQMSSQTSPVSRTLEDIICADGEARSLNMEKTGGVVQMKQMKITEYGEVRPVFGVAREKIQTNEFVQTTMTDWFIRKVK